MNFNINNHVKVKLTPFGIHILKKQHDDLSQWMNNLGEFELQLTEDGYYKTQLWCLMETFGPHIHIGTNTPFETEIILED